MTTCTFKTGIFIQRPCNKVAGKQCSVCCINLCNAHIEEADGQSYCQSCYPNKNTEKEDNTEQFVGGHTSFHRWYWLTRTQYYSEHDENPVYDASDYDSFDVDGIDDIGMDDDQDDFFDS